MSFLSKKRKASALILVFVLLILALGFLASTTEIALINTRYAGRSNQRIQALFNAESALALSIDKIEHKQTADLSGNFGEGTYSVTVTDSTSGVKKMMSQGIYFEETVQITCFYLPSVAMVPYGGKLSLMVSGTSQMVGTESSYIIKILGATPMTGGDTLEDGTDNPDPTHDISGIAYAEGASLPAVSLSVQMDSPAILSSSTILDPASYLGSHLDSLINYARLKQNKKITLSGITEITTAIGAPGDYKIIYVTGAAAAGNTLNYTASGNSYGLMVVDLTGDGSALTEPVFSFGPSSGYWHGTIVIAFSGTVVFSSATNGLISLGSTTGGVIGNVVVYIRENGSMDFSSGSCALILSGSNQILNSHTAVENALPPGSKLVWRQDR